MLFEFHPFIYGLPTDVIKLINNTKSVIPFFIKPFKATRNTKQNKLLTAHVVTCHHHFSIDKQIDSIFFMV